MDVLKVTKEGCIAAFCNMANTQSTITLNKIYGPKYRFCNRKSWKKHIGLFLQTFVT